MPLRYLKGKTVQEKKNTDKRDAGKRDVGKKDKIRAPFEEPETKRVDNAERLRQEAGIQEKKKDIYEFSKNMPGDLVIITALLTAATGISLVMENWNFQTDNLLMIYMVGGLLAAMTARLKFSGALYAAGCILLFNYVFTEPKLTFHVYDTRYFTTFAVMFIIIITVSTLVQRMKKIAKEAAAKAYRTEILLETSQKLQQAENISEIATSSIQQLEKLLGCTVYCILGKPAIWMKREDYYASQEKGGELPREELAVAMWAYENNRHAGRTTATLPGAKCLYLTVRNGKKIFAIVGVDLRDKVLTAFEKNVMLAILNEAALAFEKDELGRREHETALRLEQERLRANLLRAISHDLRTPLTSISGNADMLMESYQIMPDAERRRVFHDIYEDSVWLINLVENLLAVTRIENGTMKINLQPEMAEDVIDASVKHLRRHMGNHTLKVKQPEELLMAKMDSKLIIQVITNLVDNAVKYTPDGSEIVLSAFERDGKAVFEVADNGQGIADDQKEKIFAMFYSAGGLADSQRSMGIGLTLCRSIVEAHGGTLKVSDNIPHGAVFQFELEAEEVNI